MKKTGFFLCLILCLVANAEAYVLTIDAPPELRAGVPLVITGNTTFPSGTQFDIVLFKSQNPTPERIASEVVIVDDTKSFVVSFPTTDLESGQYKAEVIFLSDPGSKLGSSSTTLREVTIVDRSGEIVVNSPKEQDLDNALVIEGYVPGAGVTTLTMKITGPKGFSLPPRDVRTTVNQGDKDGVFSTRIPVTEPGNYYVNFYDPKGFMASIKFSVIVPPKSTISPTIPQTPDTTIPPTGLPVPVFGVLAGLAAAAGVHAFRKKG